MRKVFTYITDFFKLDFHPWYYLNILIILAFGIILNYQFDFKKKFIYNFSNSPQYFFRWLIFFAFTYFIVLLVQSAWKKDFSPFKNIKFLFRIGIALLLLSYDSYSREFFIKGVRIFEIPPQLIRWTYYMFTNFNQFIVLGLSCIIMKFIFDRKEQNIYGLTVKGFNPKPYFMMLLLMLPLIAWASFQHDFMKSYPVYKDNFAILSEYVTPWKAIGSFEICYALRFIAVELFFRGFLVIGMYKLIGERAIMPMIVLYSFWHFGKPILETTAAAFGGYILGIIALRTRSVFGGIIVHYGIALLMEIFAYFQLFIHKG